MVSYSIDDTRFDIDANGVVTVAAGASFDHETEPTITVEITATSSDTSTSSETFVIDVTDVNEAPVGPVSDDDAEANEIAEDATSGAVVGITGIATDPDGTDTVSYSIDDARFEIDANGVVTVAAGASFDHETEPTITVEITATSSDTSTSSESFIIDVTDVNEAPVGPVTDDDAAANEIAEDASSGTVVGITGLATDPDGTDTVSYSIDDTRFEIDANGVVTVAAGASFDHETEPTITVEITATSSDTSTSSESFVIDVTDVNEAPVGPVTDDDAAANEIAEDATTGAFVGITGLATDPDGTDTVSYSIDDARFEIDANGVVTVAAGASFDFETESTITVEITATSSDTSTSSESFVIDVTDVDDTASPPTLNVSDASGNEDTAIPISISAALTDTDGSESLMILIEDIPEGATLSDGTNSFTATATSTTADISSWNLGLLTITPPLHSDTDFQLTVRAKATESQLPIGAENISMLHLADLNGTNGFTINGEIFGNAGYAVSNVGDFNNDGIDDFFVGAPNATTLAGNSAGIGYLIFGDSTGFPSTFSLGDIDGTNGVAFIGAQFGRDLGWSADFAGDVNNDGIDDLIIGSSGNEAYVVFGTSSALPAEIDISTLNGSNGFTFAGQETAGWSVAGVGDINGDGIDDVAIGGPAVDPIGGAANSEDGAVYVIFGKSSAFNARIETEIPLVGNTELDGVEGFTIYGATGNDRAGTSVSSLGDVNGDGINDILIGAQLGGTGGLGEAYVVFGRSSGGFGTELDLATLNGSNGFTLLNPTGNSRAGFSVSGIGDFNGDGFNDLIIGEPDEPNDPIAVRTSYVVFGTDQGFAATIDLDSLNGTNGFEIFDGGGLSRLGFSVSGIGDFNGDGLDDLIIGDFVARPEGLVNQGQAYVIFGTTDDLSAGIDLENLSPDQGFQIKGPAAFTDTGFSVSGAGDINNDGYDDIILGAPEADPVTDREGQAFVIYGGPQTLTPADTAETIAVIDVEVIADADDPPDLIVFNSSGDEDTAIPLSLSAAAVDTDGSETLSIEISNIPVGATLSDGSNSFTASAGSTSVVITTWTLASLTITPPTNADDDFGLTVTVTATEASNGDTAQTLDVIDVTVNAVADMPALTVTDSTGDKDTAIALDVSAVLADIDGSEFLTVEISAIPVGATLSDGTNSFTATTGNTTADVSAWTLSLLTITPPSNSEDDFQLTVTATATETDGGDTSVKADTIEVTVNGVPESALFFAATTASDGRELYKVTQSGSVIQVDDINVGALASGPTMFTEFQGDLYFSAATSSFGREVYKMTASGSIVMVADIAGNSSSPEEFTEFNGELYFSATSPSFGRELYKVTSTGSVVLAADLWVGPLSSGPRDFIEFNGELFFTAINGSFGSEIYKVTSAGSVVLVEDFVPGAGGAGPSEYVIFNGELYFDAFGSGFGREVFKLTSSGSIVSVADINVGTGNSNPAAFKVFNGDLYFNATANSSPTQIYRILSTGSLETVGNLLSGTSEANLPEFTEFGDELYFSAFTTSVGYELYKITQSGSAILVADIDTAPGLSHSRPSNFTEFGGELYFTATTNSLGTELYKVTSGGSVVLVSDIYLGNVSSNPEGFTEFNGELYFRANSQTFGEELYKITSAGSVVLAEDIESGSGNSAPGEFFAFDPEASPPSLVVSDATGDEDTAIPLSVSGGLTDTDGSETLTTEVSGIPVGATLSDGTNSFIATTGNTTADISGWNLSTLTITPPADSFADFTLTVAMTSTESSGGATNTVSDTIDVTVNPALESALYFAASTPSLGRELFRLDSSGSVEFVADVLEGSNASDPGGFTEFNGEIYFTADVDSFDREIFKITAADSIVRVAPEIDLQGSGFASGDFELTEFNGELYFSAYTSSFGQELYKLTAAGSVVLVSDIFGGGDSSPRNFVSFNGDLYFQASTGSLNGGLFKLTSSGSVVPVPQSGTGLPIAFPEEFTKFNGELFFKAQSASFGRELYKITAAGNVELVADIESGSSSSFPTEFLEFNGELYFQARNSSFGIELYKVTASGSVIRTDIAVGADSSSPRDLTEFNGELYFRATSSSFGQELFKLTAAGSIFLVSDIIPGIDGSSPTDLIEFDGELYFIANSTSFGRELFKLTSTGSVVLVADILAGSASSNLADFAEFEGELFFRANSVTFGTELYKVTSTGSVVLAADPYSGTRGSSATGFTEFNGELFFTASSLSFGRELFKVATAGSVILASDIRPGVVVNFPNSSNPGGYTEFNGELYFAAVSPSFGFELYKITSSGSIVLVDDINSSSPSAGSFPREFTEINGELYFSATGTSIGTELYKVTSAGSVVLVADINTNGNSNPTGFTEFNGEIYFSATGAGIGEELYKITSTGSVLFVAEFVTGTFGSEPGDFTEFGGELYFTAGSSFSRGIYKVTSSGSIVELTGLTSPRSGLEYAEFNGELYFRASSSSFGFELFKITSSGSVMLAADIAAGTDGSFLEFLGEFNSELFFRAQSSSFGQELYKVASSGSVVLAADINVGSGSSSPYDSVEFNGELYFRAFSTTFGSELYKVTSSGSVVLAADINVGAADSIPKEFFEFGGELYFSATSSSFGGELYKVLASGSVVLVADINTGSASSDPFGFIEFGGELYFQADTMTFGTELYKLTTAGSVILTRDVELTPNSSFPTDFFVFPDESGSIV